MMKIRKRLRKTAGVWALTLALTTACSGMSMTAFADQTGTVTAGVLNVRSGPSTSNSAITTVGQGTTLNIVGSENGWYKISITVNGTTTTGYVSAEYVSTSGGSQATGSSGVVNVAELNVRAGAGTSYQIYGVITSGTSVSILGTESGWYKISVTVDGKATTGYVSKEFITVGGSAATTPAAPTETTTSSTGKVNVGALNVRNSSSTTADVLGTISEGTSVHILSTSNGWYKVTTAINGKTVTGYVYADYITKDGQAAPSQPQQTTTSTSSATIGKTNVDGLNFRSQASMSGALIGTVAQNTVVQILGTTGDWYKVAFTYNGKSTTGYLYKQYVTVTKSSSTDTTSGSLNQSDVTATFKNVNEKVYATTGVNIRSGPGTDYSVLSGLAKNASATRIAIQENTDGWSRIRYGNATGYIKSEFLTTSDPNQSSSSSVTGQAIAEFALKYKGGKYVWGGNSLSDGVDCSGFTQQVYLHFGISINRSADAQRQNGRAVDIKDVQPGDLVFYGEPGYADHVALYIGNNQVIHASSPSTGIIVSVINYRNYIQINRIL